MAAPPPKEQATQKQKAQKAQKAQKKVQKAQKATSTQTLLKQITSLQKIYDEARRLKKEYAFNHSPNHSSNKKKASTSWSGNSSKRRKSGSESLGDNSSNLVPQPLIIDGSHAPLSFPYSTAASSALNLAQHGLRRSAAMKETVFVSQPDSDGSEDEDYENLTPRVSREWPTSNHLCRSLFRILAKANANDGLTELELLDKLNHSDGKGGGEYVYRTLGFEQEDSPYHHHPLGRRIPPSLFPLVANQLAGAGAGGTFRSEAWDKIRASIDNKTVPSTGGFDTVAMEVEGGNSMNNSVNNSMNETTTKPTVSADVKPDVSINFTADTNVNTNTAANVAANANGNAVASTTSNTNSNVVGDASEGTTSKVPNSPHSSSPATTPTVPNTPSTAPSPLKQQQSSTGFEKMLSGDGAVGCVSARVIVGVFHSLGLLSRVEEKRDNDKSDVTMSDLTTNDKAGITTGDTTSNNKAKTETTSINHSSNPTDGTTTKNLTNLTNLTDDTPATAVTTISGRMLATSMKKKTRKGKSKKGKVTNRRKSPTPGMMAMQPPLAMPPLAAVPTPDPPEPLVRKGAACNTLILNSTTPYMTAAHLPSLTSSLLRSQPLTTILQKYIGEHLIKIYPDLFYFEEEEIEEEVVVAAPASNLPLPVPVIPVIPQTTQSSLAGGVNDPQQQQKLMMQQQQLVVQQQQQIQLQMQQQYSLQQQAAQQLSSIVKIRTKKESFKINVLCDNHHTSSLTPPKHRTLVNKDRAEWIIQHVGAIVGHAVKMNERKLAAAEPAEMERVTNSINDDFKKASESAKNSPFTKLLLEIVDRALNTRYKLCKETDEYLLTVPRLCNELAKAHREREEMRVLEYVMLRELLDSTGVESNDQLCPIPTPDSFNTLFWKAIQSTNVTLMRAGEICYEAEVRSPFPLILENNEGFLDSGHPEDGATHFEPGLTSSDWRERARKNDAFTSARDKISGRKSNGISAIGSGGALSAASFNAGGGGGDKHAFTGGVNGISSGTGEEGGVGGGGGEDASANDGSFSSVNSPFSLNYSQKSSSSKGRKSSGPPQMTNERVTKQSSIYVLSNSVDTPHHCPPLDADQGGGPYGRFERNPALGEPAIPSVVNPNFVNISNSSISNNVKQLNNVNQGDHTGVIRWGDIVNEFGEEDFDVEGVEDGGDAGSGYNNSNIIIAPKIRVLKENELSILNGGDVKDADSEEDISDEAMLKRHNDVLNGMKAKIDAVLEQKKKAEEERKKAEEERKKAGGARHGVASVRHPLK